MRGLWLRNFRPHGAHGEDEDDGPMVPQVLVEFKVEPSVTRGRPKRPACLPMASSASISSNRKLNSLETRLHQGALLSGKVSVFSSSTNSL